MSIPLATTSISVLQLPPAQLDEDSALVDWSKATTIASGVRAHIYPTSGRADLIGGQKEVVEYRLDADPVSLTNSNRVRDDQSGTTYLVIWAKPRTGLGLDHVEAGLRTVTGESP